MAGSVSVTPVKPAAARPDGRQQDASPGPAARLLTIHEVADHHQQADDEQDGPASHIDSQVEQAVQDQGQVGQQAGQAIVDEHKEQDDDETNGASLDAALHRVLAQGWADSRVVFHPQGMGSAP